MKRKPVIVVCAYNDVGYVCLQELLQQQAAIAAVFTHDDNPNEYIWFRSVEQLARQHNIPVYKPDNINSTENIALIRSLQPDILFSFYYRNMICQEILDVAPSGAFNMHGSLLPRYRGRVPINWAVLRGERETGATLHYMVRKADAGDIVDQQPVPIAFTDTAFDVFHKVTEAAREVLSRAYPLIAAGTPPRTPQDQQQASYFGRRTAEDGQINWSKPAVEIYNLVRAVTHPYPGAFTNCMGQKFTIWKAYPHDSQQQYATGEIVQQDPLLVATGSGLLELCIVQIDGQPEEEAKGWFKKSGLSLGSKLGG